MTQERCEQMTEMLDQLDSAEQKFTLWYLMQNLLREYESEKKDYTECKDKYELATQYMIRRHLQILQEVRECLRYDLLEE